MVLWRGRPVIVSKAAYPELSHLGMALEEVVRVLEEGYDFPRKRKEGVFEKCFDKGNETTKVVVAESYQYSSRQMVWVVVHAAKVRRCL